MPRGIKKNIRKLTLEAADAAVNGSRDTQYGSPGDNFARIARLWNAHLTNIGILSPDPEENERILRETDVALMNVLLKTGRLANDSNHPDSWTDIAGYAACGAECSQNEE